MTDEIRNGFRGQLRVQLAEATTLVWKMQNALSEMMSADNLPEMVQYSGKLADLGEVINGHVIRWELLEAETATKLAAADICETCRGSKRGPYGPCSACKGTGKQL